MSLHLSNLPFRYLRIPLKFKKIYAADCDVLIDKMIARLRLWYCKNLSYTIRLQLVTSNLMRITSYWCQLFILPRVIIRKVNSICRSFLWHNDVIKSSGGNMSWSKVCQPKSCGGLGVQNLDVWNLVVVGKLAWHINSMQESL